MPEPKRLLKVFFCHADRAVYARLIKSSVDAWLDKEELLPGLD